MTASPTVLAVLEGAAPALRHSLGEPLPHNTHIHLPPNFSAFDSVAEAVEAARAEGVRLLGVSNYYDYGVYAEFARLSKSAGIFPLFGTEIICLLDDLVRGGVRINDPANPGKMYVCGKGVVAFDPLTDEAGGLLQTIRDKDSARMADMIVRLGDVFGACGFDAELDAARVKGMVVRRHGCAPDTVYLQERHLAQAFQERMSERLGLDAQVALLTAAYGGPPQSDPNEAVATQNEIRSRLMKAGKPGYVPETFVDFVHASRLIAALGGIACYPVLADGAEPVCEFEDTPEGLIERVRGLGIACAEFIPERNSPEQLERYAVALRAAGILITAGTEHNTRDRIPITPRCKGGSPVPEAVRRLFWEGACVLVGHMADVCAGGTGFGADEAELSRLRDLGRGIVEGYR